MGLIDVIINKKPTYTILNFDILYPNLENVGEGLRVVTGDGRTEISYLGV